MFRYALAALALKAFSINTTTKNSYRQIGNTLGAKARANTDLGVYAERGDLLLEMYKKHDPLQSADRMLELGTGWMHWFAIYVRLFNDVRITTFDVWDNRQFAAFKACFRRLRELWTTGSVPADTLHLLDRVLEANDFERVYDLLGLEHMIVEDGSLGRFESSSFASVFSMHVMEHVPRDSVPSLVENIFRVTRPGRVTVHQIGIDDHLAHYDRAVSKKQYLRYPTKTWSRLFENDVQYINRLQMSDWIGAFERVGFVLVDKVVESTSVDGLRIAPEFARYSKEDLACTILTLVFRRPA